MCTREERCSPTRQPTHKLNVDEHTSTTLTHHTLVNYYMVLLYLTAHPVIMYINLTDKSFILLIKKNYYENYLHHYQHYVIHNRFRLVISIRSKEFQHNKRHYIHFLPWNVFVLDIRRVLLCKIMQ